MRQKAALAVSTDIGESGSHSSDRFLDELDEKVDCSYSAKTTLSMLFARTGDENAFNKADSLCVSTD